ncbi:MAG: 2OG-Fe(II) oxygenase [Microscillaceae bacterium]|nr:2OG-Fe(II) oxygenase [Microscillaceae bacterium]
MNRINSIYTSPEGIQKLQQEFQQGVPYKHLVMDNFLDESVAEVLYNNFPTIDLLDKHYKGLNEKKSEGANFSAFHPSFLDIKNDIMSPEFCQWVSEVTQIPDVFVTDDKLGTGLHQGTNGSFLDIHIDFNIHVEKNVHRRLNLLIYMNKNWLPEYGGDLEMWDAQMTKCEKKVAPLFNRGVIFETNEISYHGYSKITVPEHISRKSIYSYFYTALREDAVKYHDTVFKAKPEDSTVKKVGTTVKESLKNFTKAQLKKIGIKL